MTDFEDYTVHREGLADVLAGYADVPVPYVADNPHAPVPYVLTPAGEAAAEPDTWTRSHGVVTFTTNPSRSYLASLAAERAERAPEAGA
jgi:hypothetical protein